MKSNEKRNQFKRPEKPLETLFMYYLANRMSGEDICEIIINHLKQKGNKQQKPTFLYFRG